MVTRHPSLKRQLLLWLLLPQLILWLVGSLLAYRIALSYAEKGIDQSLTQSVRSLARQVKPVGSGLLVDFPKAAQAIIEEDPSDKVSYMVSSPPGSFVLGNSTLPEPPAEVSARLAAGNQVLLYRAKVDAAEKEAPRQLRVAVLELNYGDAGSPQRLRVQVAKSLAVQQRIARELILDIIVPLLLIGAAISLLVYGGIVRGLQPLQRLQAQLGEKGSGSAAVSLHTGSALATFSPIEMRKAPQEVHSLAGAVNQLLAAVQRSVSQEKRFLNDAAHQLRTPLAGLKTQLDLALRERDPAALQARLEKVNAGVERSSQLVHQLLRLARSEADIELQRIDIAQLAQDVAREAAPAALAAGIDFGYEGLEHLEHPANALLLREGLANLIDNAVRYAGAGSSVTLRVRLEPDPAQEAASAGAVANSPPQHEAESSGSLPAPQTVVLEVQDNGPGLSDAARERMFERFYRASDLQGGAGLGLAIVQEVAQRHGGTVSAVPLLPHGLGVQIRLSPAYPLNS